MTEVLGNTSYKLSNLAIGAVILISCALSLIFIWNGKDMINFMGGDAQDYYSSLVSIFINHDFLHQSSSEWYLLKTNEGVVNVHPVGIALLQLPFFLLALALSPVLGYAASGYSAPFQVAIELAALTYLVLGLIFIRKLFRLHQINDRISALMILLIYFGTTLLHYTIAEAGMSHVYSFGLISVFLYFSSRLILMNRRGDLFISMILAGLILLVRPNNVFALFTVFFWFKNFKQVREFFSTLIHNRSFYLALLAMLAIVALQPLVWYMQTGSIFQYTYKRDGFYWLNPQLIQMLFGFDGGFFVYTPLCLLLLFGLYPIYRENRFSFFAMTGFFLLLFYFFSAYWAYTYFDGLGIRVLVDYYAVFAFVGGKLFSFAENKFPAFGIVSALAAFFIYVNLIYSYQAKQSILLRSGMNFNMWKHVFLKTGPEYVNCLGGSHELEPFASKKPDVILSKDLPLTIPFDFAASEYGPPVVFENLGFSSNRIRVNLECKRKEYFPNSSADVQVCMSVEDPLTREKRSYVQFRFNETPSESCCESMAYNYSANVVGDFKAGDKLSVYLWNTKKQPFLLEKFDVKVYDYKYQLN